MIAELKQFMISQRYSPKVIEGGILGYVLPRWGAAVDEIAKGYGGSHYEYVNDVNLRDIIHSCLPYLNEEEKAEIERRLEIADNVFKSVTVHVSPCISFQDGRYSREIEWWYFLAPVSMIKGLNATVVTESNCGELLRKEKQRAECLRNEFGAPPSNNSARTNES